MYPKFNKNLNAYEIDVSSLNKRRAEPPFWTGGPQPQDPAPWANLGTFAAGAALTAGVGAMPIGRGRRGVDVYSNIVKKVEDFSPGKILRTFAISDVLFPFTKEAKFTATGMGVPRGGKITSALEAIYGKDRITRVGDVTEFKFGRSKMFGISAQLSPKTQRLIAISRAYAASQVNRFNNLLAETKGVFTHRLWRGFLPEDLVPKTPFKYTWRAREYLAKQASRVGLALPERLLGVKQGPALKMLGGLTLKASLFYLGYHGLNYLDYLRRTEESKLVTTTGGALAGAGYFAALFRNPKAALVGAVAGAAVGLLPAFDEGIYAGFAGMYTKGRLLHAKFSDYLGLTEAVKEQEELAPGITDWKTPLGFAGGGGLLTGIFLKPAFKRLGIKAFSKAAFIKGAYTGLGVYGALALGAAFLSGSVLPGLLGSDYTHEELKKVYSGETQVPIRKGRWWEFGRTPWEGTKVDYYRQHWYPRLLSHSKDISLYGSEEEKWAYDPILHPIKAIFDDEFKYHRELKNYHSRPYPISGTYFEDIPFLGPTIAGTLGKLIKPTKYMHTEKWLRQGPGGELEARYVPSAGKHEPAFELGGLKPGLALEGYDVTGVLGDQIYRLNELRGLTGFMHGSIKEALTGSQDYFDDAIRLESSSRAYGAERSYWDLNLGGLLGMTEAFRRYLPHRRRQIELYNPIPNQMPSWLPGSNYYIDFKHGDPFTKVAGGESRLPGRGYAVLHPELKRIHPEDYPLMHRFRILADVAMWSEEFKETRATIQKAKRRGELSIQDQEQVRIILAQVSQRKKKKQLKEYKFAVDDAVKTEVTIKKQVGRGKFLTEEFGDVELYLAGLNLSDAAVERLSRQVKTGTLKERREHIKSQLEGKLDETIKPGIRLQALVPSDPLNRYKLGTHDVTMPTILYDPHGVNVNRTLADLRLAEAEEGPLSQYVEYSAAQRLFGSAWELITHKGELPTEYLLPFAPFGKFIHARSAIEEYERTQVFGTESAFWQHPIAHFIKPFSRSMRSLIDESYIPEEIQHRRQLQEYFDKLKYIKYTRFTHVAEQTGQKELEEKANEIRRQTLFGLDPYGSFKYILKALPGTERDFFTAFSNASSPEERERILQLLPENERPIYIARWQGQLARQLVAEHKAGISKDAIQLLRQISKLKKTEGRQWTPELQAQYEEEVEDKQTYADWYREKELGAYFQHHPLPGPNWIGWHPKVDLEDIKLKVVETLGEDMHDYGLWQSRARTLHRKPYIDEAALSAIMQTPAINRGDMAKQLRELLDGMGISNVQITSHHLHKLNQENLIDIELTDDRQEEIRSIVERL